MELHEEFEQLFSKPKEDPMAVFWNLHLDMLQTLRNVISSIENGD